MNKHPLARRSAVLAASALCLALTPYVSAQQAPSPSAVAPDANNAASADASLDGDDVVVLSPFVVTADEDSGYVASATLAGSRVRTELKDVGSAISVATAKFLSDLGATNNETLLTYTTNTEVGGVMGNFAGAGNGRELGESNQMLRPQSNTRVRGLAAADNTRDFFLTDIPWDGYNVGRVDMQRGPNSILFGMGSPAGIVNNSLNQASFKQSGKVEFRFDNNGGVRGNLDYNHVLLADELALRVSGLSEHNKYQQKPAYSKDERGYVAMRYEPAFLKKNGMTTSLRANYETGNGHSNRPRTITPLDYISMWWTELDQNVYNPHAEHAPTGAMKFKLPDGSVNPNYNPWLAARYGNTGSGPTAYFDYSTDGQLGLMQAQGSSSYWGIGAGTTVPTNLQAQADANRYWGIGSPGAWDNGISAGYFAEMLSPKSFAYWAQSAPNETNPTSQGLNASRIDAFKEKTLGEEHLGLFDFYNKLLDGPNKREWRDFEAYNVALAQTFFNNRVGVEFAYDNQRYNDGRSGGVTNKLYVDINAYRLDGYAGAANTDSRNPNTGRAFVQLDGSASEFQSDTEAMRITAFGELRATDFLKKGTLTRILGRQVFTGMYADEERSTRSLNFTKWAFSEAFTDFRSGTNADGIKISSRQPSMIGYLSGDLRGVALNQADLQAPAYAWTPTTRSEDASPNNGVFMFDSHWGKPTNPADPLYVNPAALWVDPVGGGNKTQSENPSNYKGWGVYNAGPLLSYDNGDRAQLATRLQVSYRRVKSEAFIWQGYLLDECFVPTVGWRKDRYKGMSAEAPRYADERVKDMNWQLNNAGAFVADESLSWGGVVHTPRSIRSKLPGNTGLSFFYNRSSNFQPRPGSIDMFGNPLANPTGQTKDLGFVLTTFDDKLSLKINWYRTNVKNDRLSGFEFWRIPGLMSSFFVSAKRVRSADRTDSSQAWIWDYSASNSGQGGQAAVDRGAALMLTAYNTDPVVKNFMDGWGMTKYVDTLLHGSYWSTPPGLSGTADTLSRGLEFEINAKPLKGWDVSINASKTNARQFNIGGSLKEWIEAMEPLVRSEAGLLRQWSATDGTTLQIGWDREIMSQYNRLKAQENTDNPEIRKWRFNLINSYSFSSGLLKGSYVGAAYRWEDKVVVGYPVITRPNAITQASEMVYDVENPYYGDAENHVDLWLGYGRKLTPKIDWRIQLNVRDLFASKGLIPISVQPDGTPGAYRIREQRSWSITNTFSF